VASDEYREGRLVAVAAPNRKLLIFRAFER
jgi:hypothetical protein